MFTATISVGNSWGYSIAIIAAINAVIAFVYYGKVMKVAFFDPVPDGVDVEELEKIKLPGPIGFAMGLTAVGVILIGIVPGAAAAIGEYSAEIFAFLGL
jgi:NADH:ubiquinone oxidoreductase subunit 2 (subunit N)